MNEPDMDASSDLLSAREGGQSWLVVRPVPIPRERARRMAEHLLYEIEAANACAYLASIEGRSDLRDFAPRTREWWRGNALVEAAMLHVRSLDEFFYKDAMVTPDNQGGVRLHRDDVTALNFIREPQVWLDARPSRPDALEKAWRRINRTLMHLSWKRTAPDWDTDHNAFAKEQSWDVFAPWDSLKPTINTFLEHTNQGALCEGFHYHAQRAMRDQAVALDLAHGGE